MRRRWPRVRYEQVDPQLRLVAAALERAWEEALQAQTQLEQEWEGVQAAQLQAVSEEDVALVQQMAADLPALWAAESTSLATASGCCARCLRCDAGQVSGSGRHPYRGALANGGGDALDGQASATRASV
jgi:hypothetical protein